MFNNKCTDQPENAMNHLTRDQINANLKKSFGTSTNAHPAVQIFSRHARNPSISSLSKEMLIDGPREVRATNCQIYVVRYTAIVGRMYVAQSWTTGIEHTLPSIGALKSFLSGKNTH